MNGRGARKKSSLATGFRMRYREFGPADAPTIILLHGLTDSSRSWSLTVPFLGGQYHILVPDQRGHGDSEKPPCCYTIPAFAADVIAFMDALHINQAVIVGHSMGSLVASQIGIEYPSRVNKLVLIASAATAVGNTVLTDFVWATIPTLTEPIDPNSQFIQDWTSNPNPVDTKFLELVKPETAGVPIYVWSGATRGLLTDDHSHFLKDVKAPTLIIWGDQDSIFSQADQDTLAKLMPQAVSTVFKKAGHNVQWEQPELVAKAIQAFIAGQRP